MKTCSELTQERLAHTHFTQTLDLVTGCPACGRINPERMTKYYAYTEALALKERLRTSGN